MQLTVYTRRGCHLCSDMLQALEGLRDELGFQLVDIDIESGIDAVVDDDDVNAILDGPPPPTVENPTPPLEEGDLLPFVPPWVVRLDVGVDEDLAELGKYPLHGRLGLAYTCIGARPLPFSQRADPFSLLDLSAGLSWWFLELGFQVFNLLDKQYAGNEFVFVSDWDPQSVGSRVPARHISAGRPRFFLFTIGIRL